MERDIGDVPTTAVSKLSFAEAIPKHFPLKESKHNQPAFAHFIESAYPPGETSDPGPTTMWMKTVRLLANEEMSSFQRMCPLADCGNALSRNAELSEIGFMNTDLTIVAYRQTSSDWLASSSISHWHANGLGFSNAVLQDVDGVIGMALQTLILTPN